MSQPAAPNRAGFRQHEAAARLDAMNALRHPLARAPQTVDMCRLRDMRVIHAQENPFSSRPSRLRSRRPPFAMLVEVQVLIFLRERSTHTGSFRGNAAS